MVTGAYNELLRAPNLERWQNSCGIAAGSQLTWGFTSLELVMAPSPSSCPIPRAVVSGDR